MAPKVKTDYPQWFLDELDDSTERTLLLSGHYKGSDKLHFRCADCGLVYIQSIANHITKDNQPKQGCPNCAKKKRAESHKLTSSKNRLIYPDWFIGELYDDNDKEKARQGTLSTHTKVAFKCSCGKPYIQQITNHINLSTGERKFGSCSECSKKKISNSYRKSLGTDRPYPDWFIDELYDDKDKEKARMGELKADDKVLFYCPVCKETYSQRVASHITLSTHERKKGCPKCGIEKQRLSSRKTRGIIKPYPDWFIEDIYLDADKEKARNFNFLSNELKQFYCREHNVVYTQAVGQHIDVTTHERKYSGCPQCSRNKFKETLAERREYPEWFINDLVHEEDKEKARNGTLSSVNSVDFVCKKGHIYKQLVKSHIHIVRKIKASGCPICSKMRSETELKIEGFIKSLGFSVIHPRFHIDNRNLEIDIFIPEKNIGIEYNGSFWHKTLPNDSIVKNKKFHLHKYSFCKKLGIHLVTIFDVDWFNHSDKVKQFLHNILLGMGTLYARKCFIKQIDYREANTMYDKYHLLGKTTVQSISYGLFYNNELVSCMSFQKGRYKENKESVWCLTRFVTKSGLTVVGGASKLLKQFEKEFNPSLLISFSDNDYFSGGVYEKLGFENKGYTSTPRYFWFFHNKEIKREQCQLKKLAKKYPDLYKESLNISGNKEDYIMLKLGAFKVYRSGHTKWVKNYY